MYLRKPNNHLYQIYRVKWEQDPAKTQNITILESLNEKQDDVLSSWIIESEEYLKNKGIRKDRLHIQEIFQEYISPITPALYSVMALRKDLSYNFKIDEFESFSQTKEAFKCYCNKNADILEVLELTENDIYLERRVV